MGKLVSLGSRLPTLPEGYRGLTVGLSTPEQIRRIGNGGRLQVVRTDPDQPETPPIDLTADQRDGRLEQHLGALSGMRELTVPGDNPKICSFELDDQGPPATPLRTS